MKHLEKYDFEWENTSLQFKYEIKLSADKKKLIKTISMKNGTRKELLLDEQRITSVELDPAAPTESSTFVNRSNLLAYFGQIQWYKHIFLLELKQKILHR